MTYCLKHFGGGSQISRPSTTPSPSWAGFPKSWPQLLAAIPHDDQTLTTNATNGSPTVRLHANITTDLSQHGQTRLLAAGCHRNRPCKRNVLIHTYRKFSEPQVSHTKTEHRTAHTDHLLNEQDRKLARLNPLATKPDRPTGDIRSKLVTHW